MGEESIMRGIYNKCIQNFGRKTWKKRWLGRTTLRWDDNTKMGLREI